MNGSRKVIYLFLALILPGLVFMFLKYFGENEFAVEPLFVKEVPAPAEGCMPVLFPYQVPDSVKSRFISPGDSLVLIQYGLNEGVSASQWRRVLNEYKTEAIHFVVEPDTTQTAQKTMKCSFLLREPFNGVLVDRRGVIRGQYDFSDREDVDRLIMEIAIILKKY